MGASAFGWLNYVTQSGAVITAGNQLATMQASNIAGQSGAPSAGWQTQNGTVTNAAGANLLITAAVPAQVWGGVGVFRTNLTPQSTVTFSLLSSGVSVWSQAVAGPVAGYQQAIAFPPNVTADALSIGFDDPTNPSGFINVPLVYGGAIWNPATNPAWSSTFGRDDGTDIVVSRGGQETLTLRWQRRRWNIDLEGVRASEEFVDVDAIRMNCRDGRNALFVPDVASANLPMEAIFGRLVDTADISWPFAMADRRAWKATAFERI